jgi:twitching motility protein PilT
MANPSPVPLLGRLALQLKLVNQDQLRAAMQNASGSGASIAEVLLEMGLVNAQQLQKLEQVQRDVIAKHRAKRAAESEPAAAPAPERQAATAAPAAPQVVHAAAARAAQDAAPISGPDVLELAEPVAAPAAKAPPAATDAAPASTPTPRPATKAPHPTPASEHAGFDPAAGLGLEIELPPPDPAYRARLESLLQAAVAAGASDVHFHSQGPILWRIGGELIKQDGPPVERGEVEALVSAALTDAERQVAMREGEIDYCLELPGVGRFRANSYRQQRGFDSVYRVVSAQPPTLEELGLPDSLRKFTTYHQGMVLITGPAGCGKSATMAALVNLINEEREEHILCIEDPIEILHPSKKCLVNQRHAGRHTESFARALRGALREDPDVIVIGELRDLETISLAMTAAETGHFVLATLHTNNAVRTINRMIGAFPASEQGQIRTMLSESLRAVISQRLVPRADGQGRAPALELLVLNKAISNLVRDEKTTQIRSSIQTGKSHGMYLLEQSLNEMVEKGTITRDTALRFAEDEKLITAK